MARNGYDSVTTRAVVPGRRKAVVLAQAVLRGCAPGQADTAASLPACRALVQAASIQPRRAPRRSFDDRAAWLLDLFERLDDRRQSPARR